MTDKKRIERILSDARAATAHLDLAVWRRLDRAEFANRAGADDAPVLVRNLSRNAVELLLDVWPETTLFDNGDYGTCDDPSVLAHGSTWILYATRGDVCAALDECDALKDAALDLALSNLNSDHEGRVAFTERSVERANTAMRRRLVKAWTTYPDPVAASA